MSAPPEQPPRGIRLATIASIPVYLGWSWLIMGGLVVFVVGPSAAQSYGAATGYSIAVVYALALLVSVLAHEAAHAIAARTFGHTVHRVVADLWGGHTAFEASRATPATSAAIAVVGPLTNAVLGVVCLVASTALDGIPGTVLGGVAFVNGALAVLNLLPVPGLDGYGALEPFLALNTQRQIAQVKPYGLLILVALLFVPEINVVFFDAIYWLFELSGVPRIFAQYGNQLMRFWL